MLSTDLVQLPSMFTATGDSATITVDESSGVITINDETTMVFVADIEASNGLVHAVDTVLVSVHLF